MIGERGISSSHTGETFFSNSRKLSYSSLRARLRFTASKLNFLEQITPQRKLPSGLGAATNTNVLATLLHPAERR